MTPTRVVYVVPCGKMKQPNPCQARELYTGLFTRRCLSYAEALARQAPSDSVVLMMSARYGLVPLSQTLEPYDITWGHPGAVSVKTLTLQAKALGLVETEPAPRVVCIGGKTYLRKLRRAAPQAVYGFPDPNPGIKMLLLWLSDRLRSLE